MTRPHDVVCAPAARWATAAVGAAAVLSAAPGLVGLVGLYSHREALLRVFASTTPIVYDTALGLVLIGAGLGAVSLGRPRWAYPAALYGLIFGALGLLENVTGHSFGIDEVFMRAWVVGKGKVPGRMAPNAAVCFGLAGFALLMCARRRTTRQAAVVGIAGSAVYSIAIVALFGYAADVPNTYGWGQVSPIALPAALGFAVVGVGLVGAAYGFLRAADAGTGWFVVPVGAGVLTVVLFLWAAIVRVGPGTPRSTGAGAAGATVVLAWLVAALAAVVLALLGRLHRARQVDAQRAHHAELAAGVSDALAATGMSESGAMQEIADKLALRFGDVCVLARLSDDGRALVPVASRCVESAFEDAVHDAFFPLRFDAASRGLTGQAISTRQVLRAGGTVATLTEASRPELAALFAATGIHSAVIAPMRSSGKVVGAVMMLRHRDPAPYTDDDAKILEDVADRAGAAIDNAHLVDVARTTAAVLAESEERFRSAFEGAPIAVALGDMHEETRGRYVWVNDAFCVLVGYTREQLATTTIHDLSFPDDYDADDAVLAALTANERVEMHERRYRRADGEPVWARVHAARIGREEDQLAIGFYEDVTAEREAAAREAHLLAQVRQAQRLESVGRLAGGLAHDYRNLLAVISMSVEMILQETDDSSPLLADAQAIAEAARRGADLSRQLLTFSRHESPQPASVDLAAAVGALEDLLRRTLGNRIRLSVGADADVPTVLIDPAQFDQILMNLAVNAHDAMPSGGTLTIAVRRVVVIDDALLGVEPGEYVVVEVSDTGSGMPREVLEKVFDPFFTTKEHGQGTGLGLATVHGIVTGAGGTVHVDSTVGAGTTVRVWLPAATPGARTDVAPDRHSTQPPDGTATVLVVDDEPMVLQLTARVLTEAGYQVIAAPGGEEALALAGERGFAVDLLVTDVMMPGLTGPELWQRLIATCPSLPALFMSGYTGGGLASLVGMPEMDDGAAMIEKPFRRDDLLAAVGRLVSAPVAP